MTSHTPPTDQELDAIEAWTRSPLGPGLVAEQQRMAALVDEVRRLRAQVADLGAENAKLIRWHGEDDKSLNRMRNTIVRLRTELAEKTAAVPAVEAGE